MKLHFQKSKRIAFSLGFLLCGLLIISACTSSRKISSTDRISGQFTADSILNVMKKVADWQQLGTIVPGDKKVTMKEAQKHLLTITEYRKDKLFTYYQGAGWQKSGSFPDVQTWYNYLKAFSDKQKYL